MDTGSDVLVTGALGNLGQKVTEELRRRGHGVIPMDLPSPRNRRAARRLRIDDAVRWGDLCRADLSDAIEDVAAVIHLAAVLPPVTETAPGLAHRINVEATLRLVEAIEKSRRRPLLVYPSSVTVFGPPDATSATRCMRADDPVVPSDRYTRHKIEVERALASSDIPWAVLRVGVSVDSRTLGSDRSTLRTLFGVHPDNPLEYVHPNDVALAMVNVIGRPEAWRRVLLIGGGERCQVTQHAFLSAALDAIGVDLPREMLGSHPYYTRWMDTRETQALLDFQRHGFDDYCIEMRRRARGIRPLLAPFAPLVRWGLRRMLK